MLLALHGAGCSGKAIMAGSAAAGGSAEASGGAGADGGSSPAAAGSASNRAGAGNAEPNASGAGSGGLESHASAGASTAGGVAASASGAGGAGLEPFVPGPPLMPMNGWIDAESNAFLIRGAVFPFADSSSKIAMDTNFTGTNACIRGSTAKVDLSCTPVPPATDCYAMFFGAAIGLNLNQQIDPVTMLAAEPESYNAGLLRGFAFDLFGDRVPSPKDLRFQVETTSQAFCNLPRVKLKAGTNVVLFSDMVTDCFEPTTEPDLRPTAETAKSSLVKISWRVVTNVANEVPYDFCIANIRPIRK